MPCAQPLSESSLKLPPLRPLEPPKAKNPPEKSVRQNSVRSEKFSASILLYPWTRGSPSLLIYREGEASQQRSRPPQRGASTQHEACIRQEGKVVKAPLPKKQHALTDGVTLTWLGGGASSESRT
jgi:hypothetical protein